MVTKNNNSNLTKEIIDVGKIQSSTDFTPSEFAEKILYVCDVNPKHSRITNIVRNSAPATSGTVTVYTTPSGAGQEFYLTSIQLGMTKDATCDAAIGSVQVTATIGGISRGLIGIPILTTTAQSHVISITYKDPIKIDSNVAIAVSGSYSLGLMARYVTLHGFQVDNAGA